MLNSETVNKFLTETLSPISIQSISFSTKYLQSSVLISTINGSILSYSNLNDSNNNTSINNLKMMSLLCRDKWREDENDVNQQSTKCCYRFQWKCKTNNDKPYETRIYTYEIEEFHACMAHIPESDLILIFFADKEYPYGLLVMKMKSSIAALENLYGYKLG